MDTASFNVQIESRKVIKPSIPTPPNLRNYKIGFMDELAPRMRITTLLFFSPNKDHNPKFVAQLEKSLEKTLTRLYPLAGRYVQETHTVDCNDQGVKFIRTKANLRVQDVVDSQWNANLIDKFIPSNIMLGGADQIGSPILATQVNTFVCGGVALGVSISHRIADVSTLSTFLNEWAAINQEDYNQVESSTTGPGFSVPSFFPGRLSESPKSTNDDVILSNLVTKKVSFSESEISNMKAQCVIGNEKNGIHHLTKVQLVSAMIWKSLLDVDRAMRNHHQRDSNLIQVLGLRGRTASLIPKDSCGNLLVPFFTTKSGRTNDDTTQRVLAYLLSGTQKEVISNYSKLSHESEEGQLMALKSWSQIKYLGSGIDAHSILVSSWCKLPYYEADFGFGKPIWVTVGSIPRKSGVYLIEGMGGSGIDAYVCMELKAIPYFGQAFT